MIGLTLQRTVFKNGGDALIFGADLSPSAPAGRPVDPAGAHVHQPANHPRPVAAQAIVRMPTPPLAWC